MSISNRVPKLLNYIHDNLHKTLLVDDLAKVTHCSRWQIQRDFTQATGFSIAQYVRRLKLAKAAELLIESNTRQLDIVMSCGFDSEISFHRSFKRQYACTPGQYRKRGIKTGIYLPLNPHHVLPMRIEHKDSFSFVGLSVTTHGNLSEEWGPTQASNDLHELFFKNVNTCEMTFEKSNPVNLMVVNVRGSKDELLGSWVGVANTQPIYHQLTAKGLKAFEIPNQSYLVITQQNKADIGRTDSETDRMSWALDCWLPNSRYKRQKGLGFEICVEKGVFEYWIPIANKQVGSIEQRVLV